MLRLAGASLAVSLAGVLVAVVIAVVSLATPDEDADLGLASAFLVAGPMLLPLTLSAVALALRRSAGRVAFTLAAVAAGLLVTGALGVAAVFLPSVLG